MTDCRESKPRQLLPPVVLGASVPVDQGGVQGLSVPPRPRTFLQLGARIPAFRLPLRRKGFPISLLRRTPKLRIPDFRNG